MEVEYAIDELPDEDNVVRSLFFMCVFTIELILKL